MSIDEFLHKLRRDPASVEFAETIAVIDSAYAFHPCAFTNGALINAAGQNNGSCKIFSFAQLHGLSEPETLALFGRYYREDVLQNPHGTDHQNIRNFIETGWGGMKFSANALAGISPA